MSDPIDDAFKSLHQGNLSAAKDARIRQLEERLETLRYAGNELSRVMEDILGSGQITCQISKAVMTSTVAKWKEARFGK